MAQSLIKRIGVIVKPHQPDALETLCRLTSWLSEHGITLVGPAEVERETIEHRTGCTIDVVHESELAGQVDLMLVLGGDGTMIATVENDRRCQGAGHRRELRRPGISG
jgi:NAD kinase